MTTLMFGVAASSFAANMTLKQNAINHRESHPKANQVVVGSFDVHDGLTGAESVEEAIKLRTELQELFRLGGFTLRKWKSSDRDVLSSIPEELTDPTTTQEIILEDDYIKVLGVEWNVVIDCFRPLISLPELKTQLTKCELVSNIARLFDVLGWCYPAIM